MSKINLMDCMDDYKNAKNYLKDNTQFTNSCNFISSGQTAASIFIIFKLKIQMNNYKEKEGLTD